MTFVSPELQRVIGLQLLQLAWAIGDTGFNSDAPLKVEIELGLGYDMAVEVHPTIGVLCVTIDKLGVSYAVHATTPARLVRVVIDELRTCKRGFPGRVRMLQERSVDVHWADRLDFATALEQRLTMQRVFARKTFVPGPLKSVLFF